VDNKSDSLVALILELLLTVCVCVAVVVSNINVVRNESRQYTSEIESDYRNFEDRYVSVFKAVVVPVEEMINKDPPFDEMQAWLQSHDKAFEAAVGEGVYDGLAMTYKGGYVHSWDYGDYSDYDPNTRPWYQAAQKAGGEVTVVAPYISFLGDEYLSSDQLIIMTVAQKYTDEISFDLDLKISELASLVNNRTIGYDDTTALFFNSDGYILSASDQSLYSHNVDTPDDALSAELSSGIKNALAKPGELVLTRLSGRHSYSYFYAASDDLGNTCCVIIPFSVVFAKHFLLVGIVLVLLITMELSIFRRNSRIFSEMSARDSLITSISRAAFKKQLYVDLGTMKCTCDDEDRDMINTDDYHAVYNGLCSVLADDGDRDDFAAVLSPEALSKREGAGFTRKKFAFDLMKNGVAARYVLEFSIFATNTGGRPTAVILGNNVTDKEKKQQRLLQSIAHHYAAALTGNTATRRVDIIKLDEYYQTVFDRGISADELHARFADAYVREEYRQAFLEAVSFDYIDRRLHEEDGYSITIGLNNGHWHTIRIIRDEDFENTHEFVMSVEYADEQMRQQEALQEALSAANDAMRAKTDFLSRMSHDIRTPMNGIIGMTRIARGEDNPPKTADCLEKIDISSQYLLGLINDILDMTRIESGGIELHPEPYFPGEFSDYISSVIRPLCEAKKQRFTVTGDTSGEYVPLVDKLRVNQVVFNLLSNAVKYTPEGGDIELHIEKKAANGKLDMLVWVKDSGRGMSREFQKVLFEPFAQEDRVRSMSGTSNSSGLGLAIVKKIIDLMGGTIEVESRENLGSKFAIRCSVDYADAALYSSDETSTHTDVDRLRLAGKRVLLCEDNAINQEIARSLLEQANMEVTLAGDGFAAVKAFSASPEGHYDFILMDIRMPVMDGYEATRDIRRLERSDAAAVPIIAMTADAFADDVQRCLAAGMNGHIAKPLDPAQLYGTMLRFLPQEDAQA